MQILLSAEEIIKRCLWSKYKKFALNKVPEEKIREIVEKNEPFVIEEELAYVIGLLKVVETSNLVHRFNQDVVHLLNVRSTINNEKVLINKSVIVKEIIEYKNRFPEYYIADKEYSESISELNEYITEVYNKIIEIDEIKITKFKGNIEKVYTFLLSNAVKKTLNLKR